MHTKHFLKSNKYFTDESAISSVARSVAISKFVSGKFSSPNKARMTFPSDRSYGTPTVVRAPA
jgi:hypothetical protein